MSSAPRQWAAVAVGGAGGAWARWAIGQWAPDGGGFPWTTFVINVLGSLVLAGLPALAVVRHHHLLAVGLGPGLLGGFTTLSATSEQARALLASGRLALAAAYVGGTLAAALLAVTLADHWSRPAEQQLFADEDGDR